MLAPILESPAIRLKKTSRTFLITTESTFAITGHVLTLYLTECHFQKKSLFLFLLLKNPQTPFVVSSFNLAPFAHLSMTLLSKLQLKNNQNTVKITTLYAKHCIRAYIFFIINIVNIEERTHAFRTTLYARLCAYICTPFRPQKELKLVIQYSNRFVLTFRLI